MLAPLANPTYRRLFAAQAVSILGTGLATVALALLAYELAGAEAGAVLGTALAIKMIAYVGIAPLAGAYANRFPRRALLIAMDLVRAAVVLALPFVDQVWQIYLLIFLLQSASAVFTPTFQATIPDVLPDEKDYTNALSLSRLAYDLESLISPGLAAALLLFVSFHWLFAGTVVGFLASAAFVLAARPPSPKAASAEAGPLGRTTRGLRIYLATPRLRGLLALNAAVAAAGAMVIVNTVVAVKGLLGFGEAEVGLALAVYGAGSMAAALAAPRLLERLGDRPVMLGGAAGMTVLLVALGVSGLGGAFAWPLLLLGWLGLGLGNALVMTPSGRLLRRSARAEDRPAVFAAQFALSHACWLVTYPLAGWLGLAAGLDAAFLALGAIAAIGLVGARNIWPKDDPEVLPHSHDDLPPDHPHIRATARGGADRSHAHAFVIDDEHRHWPTQG
ncbi:MAG: MFS transporter [Kiloniellales bacterium]|nr:MFS transporter [Kiloniellales bacterium]